MSKPAKHLYGLKGGKRKQDYVGIFPKKGVGGVGQVGKIPRLSNLCPIFQFQFLPIKIIIWKVYVTWLYLIFMYILPFTLLAVLNLMIYM